MDDVRLLTSVDNPHTPRGSVDRFGPDFDVIMHAESAHETRFPSPFILNANFPMLPPRSLLARRLLPAAAAVGLFLAACTSTKLTTSWKAPEAGSIHFTKILVMAVAPVDSLRHPAEDAMRAQIKTVPVVTSYELLPKAEDGSDPVKLAAAIKAAGVDGIIVMRMVSSDSEVGYTTGGMMPSYYTSFNSYYSYNFGGYHNYYNNRYAAQAAFYYDPPKCMSTRSSALRRTSTMPATRSSSGPGSPSPRTPRGSTSSSPRWPASCAASSAARG